MCYEHSVAEMAYDQKSYRQSERKHLIELFTCEQVEEVSLQSLVGSAQVLLFYCGLPNLKPCFLQIKGKK